MKGLCSKIAETQEMESPSAQNCAIKAQEDSTSVDTEQNVLSSCIEETKATNDKNGDECWNCVEKNLAEKNLGETQETTTERPSRNDLSPSNSPVKNCKVLLLRVFDSPSKNDKNLEKSEREESVPVSVIGKLEENEEIVLTNSLPIGEGNRTLNQVDSSMLSSPEKIAEVSLDILKTVDTEIKTETSSDCSKISPLTTTTTAIVDISKIDNSYYPINEEDRCENLMCERVQERREEKLDKEPINRPSNNHPCSQEAQIEDVEMGFALAKPSKDENLENDTETITTDSLRFEESLKLIDRSIEDQKDGNSFKTILSPITPRKRPASDFLPIAAEIKRVGVEISEEEANQLRNDVRRLSPVSVSQREKTLGEISLTSKSCLFSDKTEVRGIFKNSNIVEKSNNLDNKCNMQDVDKICEKNNVDLKVIPEIITRLCSSPSKIKCINSNINDIPNCSRKLDYDSEEETLGTAIENVQTPIKNFNKSSVSNSTSPSSPTCRNLLVVLNRIKETKTKNEYADKNLDERWDHFPEKEVNSVKDSSEENLETRETTMEKQWQNNSFVPNSPLKECKVLLSKILASPTKNDKSPKKSEKEESIPAAVIGKLDVNEEIVLTNTLPVSEDNRVSSELDSSMLSSPEAMPEVSVDISEVVDTETETETGSDSSEVSSMTNIRLHDDVDVTSDQLSCPESESLRCMEMAPVIMTRLETERPEAYTEDSAESLALATVASDEVRSDGSDSGLGGEISGDSGPTPAPESDSETSFLDRIPDDILSDKEKAVNQLESFVPTSNANGTSQVTPLSFQAPSKGNLKRRLTDCMENEQRNDTDEPVKKKRNIQFDAVTVYYFSRAQGFTCVPSQGGSTLGMSATHTHAERFSLLEHAAEQRRIHRARLAQLRSERAANCIAEAASSSEDPSDDTDEEPSDNEELDIDSYYFLQPVPTWQRRALLRAAGVRRIDAVEKDECRDIRASREHCGCSCKGYCDPESCPCSRASVKCQVDRAGFPCGCSRDGCANSSGRIEFNPVRVRTHFIHTLMRLKLEKKQLEEENGDHGMTDNQNNRGPLRNCLGSVMDIAGTDTCMPGTGISGGGFTTLHYENHHEGIGVGMMSANCQPEIPGTREDSLDLYAIRDDCYPNDDTVDSGQSSQRKLHPEFSQAFQSFSGQTASISFQQSSYQDYQSYVNLPSTSRVQFQPQFQSLPGNPGFSHYGGYGQDTGVLQNSCQLHPGQHSSYETVFAPEDTTGSQYTNLNSIQPMNAVVQQMGKLEPFSELLSGRYSYYGEMEPQQHGTYHNNGAKIEMEPSQVTNEQQSESTEDCDENFGEIIKKSMVETVSA